jgi:hypothetical protein
MTTLISLRAVDDASRDQNRSSSATPSEARHRPNEVRAMKVENFMKLPKRKNAQVLRAAFGFAICFETSLEILWVLTLLEG